MSTNTSGYTGVIKKRKRFSAEICVNKKKQSLGSYDTPKEAALAYDRAVVQHKLSSSRLNFPDDASSDDNVNPQVKRRTSANNTSGYRGVSKISKKQWRATLKYNKVSYRLGRFFTPHKAAMAYDKEVVRRGLPRSKLNYPNVDHSKKGANKKAAAQQLIQSGGLAGPQRSEKELRSKAKYDKRRKGR